MAVATPPASADDPERLTQVFRALGDPTRRAIITQLSHGEATMTEIADRFDMTLPGVSKHVTVLERAGLVDRWRAGRTRHCRLRPEPMNAANAWIESQTRFWTETLDALADFLEDGEQAR